MDSEEYMPLSNELEPTVDIKTLIPAIVPLAVIFSILGFIFLGVPSETHGSTSAYYTPSQRAPAPGGGGAPSSYGSMEYYYHYDSPWYSFFNVSHYTEMNYFNGSFLYDGGTLFSKGVSNHAVPDSSGDSIIININGPHNIMNGTLSNGVQFSTFIVSVEFDAQFLSPFSHSVLGNEYTNLLSYIIEYGNGNIDGKVYINNNELFNYISILNTVIQFSQTALDN